MYKILASLCGIMILILLGLNIAQETIAKSTSAVIVTVSPTPTVPPFESYPQFIRNFLESGGDPTTLENLLRSWQNITDELGGIELRNSSAGQLIITHVFRPLKDGETPSDRLMIFLLKNQKVHGVFDSSELVRRSGYIFDLMPERMITPDRLPDVVFKDRFCGAHTCYESLHIAEWDGQDFVMRLNGELRMPYPHYLVDLGQITAVSGHEGSAGAGAGRAYTEIWQWNGSVFTVTEKIVGPPMIRMHIIHDADAAFEQGDLNKAGALYQQAIDDENLWSQTFYHTDEDAGAKVIDAYANFKLMIVHAIQEQTDKTKEHYERLIADNSSESPAYLFVLSGRAFWNSYLKMSNVELACEAAIAVTKADSTELIEQLYVGYAFTNRVYRAEDICRIPIASNQ
ncbi:MAG: hypothetical protein GY797_11865 [Deltaproteobacteria bacterium]|nr:hypothetical protein [Deltaproteobacteria bacterium]